MKAADYYKALTEKAYLQAKVELLEARLEDALHERDQARIAVSDERHFWRNELDKALTATSPKPETPMSDLIDSAEDKEQAKKAEEFSKNWHDNNAFWHETTGFTITEGKDA